MDPKPSTQAYGRITFYWYSVNIKGSVLHFLVTEGKTKKWNLILPQLGSVKIIRQLIYFCVAQTLLLWSYVVCDTYIWHIYWTRYSYFVLLLNFQGVSMCRILYVSASQRGCNLEIFIQPQVQDTKTFLFFINLVVIAYACNRNRFHTKSQP